MFGVTQIKIFPLVSIRPVHLHPQRFFCTPTKLTFEIPKSKLQINFSRSSGPGTTTTRSIVEIRFHVDTATWIPKDIRDRFKEYNDSRMTKAGEVIFISEKGRTQEGNIKDCMHKLEEALLEASVPPKERIPTEAPEYAHENRLAEKKVKSQVKKSRNWKSSRDY